jgi:hypothetical protein
MRHRAISQVDTVVIEEAVLTGDLQMVSSGQVQDWEGPSSIAPSLPRLTDGQVRIAVQALAWLP